MRGERKRRGREESTDNTINKKMTKCGIKRTATDIRDKS